MQSSDLIRSDNSLNTVRLFAAGQVMFLHLASVFPETGWMRAIRSILNLFPGVPIFFMLSGYLIWHSIETSRSYPVYLKKRFLRIYPELWISVLLELLCLVLLSGQRIPLLDLLLFGFGQSTVFQFWKPQSVTGYGTGTPNGALWTIPVMVTFYVLVWWVHRVLHRKNGWVWTLWLLAALAVSCLFTFSGTILPSILFKLIQYSLIPYIWLFLIGMYTAEHIEKLLPFLKKYWAFLLILAMLLQHPRFTLPTWGFSFVNSVLLFGAWIGAAYRMPKLNIRTDISYGLYIYHMLVVNALITLFGTTAPWVLPAVILLSFLAAWLSTKLSQPLIGRIRAKILP